MSKTLPLAKHLIQQKSLTPEDAGCQKIISDRLSDVGFSFENLKFFDVDNLWAIKGTDSPVFVFAGHTDVVPVGDLNSWKVDPFAAEIHNDNLYGRGAADMKGSLAAMVTATEKFVADYPNHKGSIGFLITSDEEGPAVNGTVKVCEYLNSKNQPVDFCLVGEPSSTEKLGDVIKNGRRGSLNGRLVINGKQGHIAYPHLAKNPIHIASETVSQLVKENWDQGNEYFPATSFQISNINSGTGATNVIPNSIEILFNFRYSTETTHEELMNRVEEIISNNNLDYDIEWDHSGYPFLTEKGQLVSACSNAIQKIKKYKPTLSTSGGTSDGRFIAPMLHSEVVELGPINSTIHKIDEHVSVDDLDRLSEIYYEILVELLA